MNETPYFDMYEERKYRRLLRSRLISADTIHKIAEKCYSLNGGLLTLVASHGNTSVETLNLLSKHPLETLRFYVAGNKNTSVKTLDFLSNDVSEIVVEQVALNNNTPADTLRNIFNAHSQNLEICCRLSLNNNLPTDIIMQICESVDDVDVLCLILINPNITEEALKILSKHVSPNIRYYVALSFKTPLEVLQQLSEDISPSVSGMAKKTLENLNS